MPVSLCPNRPNLVVDIELDIELNNIESWVIEWRASADAVAASLIRSDDCKYALLLDASIASTTKVSDFVEEFGDDNFNEPEYPDDSQDMGEIKADELASLRKKNMFSVDFL